MGVLNESRDLTTIKDSGNRTEYATGAVRDLQEEKGRPSLMPLEIVGELINENRIELMCIDMFKEKGNRDYLKKALNEFIKNEYPNTETAMLELAIHFEEGAKKYGVDNWKKGLPVEGYINSSVRHYLENSRGDKDEPHKLSFMWNLICCIWTCDNMPETNTYTKAA